MPIFIDGKSYFVPDVYGATQVVNLASGAIPAFNGLLMIGKAKKGIPYDGGLGQEVIKAYSDPNSLIKDFGRGDLVTAFKQAKKQGAGVIYVVNVAKTTQTKATIVNATKSVFDVTTKGYGQETKDIQFSVVTADTKRVISVKPVKNVFFINKAVLATDTTIFFEDVEGLAVGDFKVMTATGIADVKILEVNVNGKFAVLSVAVGKAIASGNNIFQVDEDNEETYTVASTDPIEMIIEKVNAGSKLVTLERKVAYDGVIADMDSYVGEIASATKGTSPNPTEIVGGDWDILAGKLPQLFEEFSNFTKARVRLVNILTPNASIHAIYRDLATTLRGLYYSIKVIAGCDKGDIEKATSDTAHPIKRAKALNSDEITLAGMGVDDLPAYLSLAPQYAGILQANSVKHNITWDNIVAGIVEKFFGESNKETETATYLQNGVLIARTGANGFFIAQAVNTYQNQANIWDMSNERTYLDMQRQIADFAFEVIRKELLGGVGNEAYSLSYGMKRVSGVIETLVKEGILKGGSVESGKTESGAMYIVPTIIPAESIDFIGFTMKIIIPN